MNKNFTKDDLKVGYVVRCRNNELHMYMKLADGSSVIIDEYGSALKMEHFDDDLRDKTPESVTDYTITEVYGYSESFMHACRISTYRRPLLWKREKPTRMTLSEIEMALGFKIEIVEEDK